MKLRFLPSNGTSLRRASRSKSRGLAFGPCPFVVCNIHPSNDSATKYGSSVHHGRIFSTPPDTLNQVPIMTLHTPPPTLPSTPTRSGTPLLPNKVTPYVANGFIIQESLIYISDVSFIPDKTWAILEELRERNGQPSVAIIDCLRPEKHTSHFGLKEAVSTARRIGAMRSYCVGFGHDAPHTAYENIFGAMDGRGDGDGLTTAEQRGIEMIEVGDPIWIRPAYDGLQVTALEGTVRDNGY
jgi:hypothetical protein